MKVTQLSPGVVFSIKGNPHKFSESKDVRSGNNKIAVTDLETGEDYLVDAKEECVEVCSLSEFLERREKEKQRKTKSRKMKDFFNINKDMDGVDDVEFYAAFDEDKIQDN